MNAHPSATMPAADPVGGDAAAPHPGTTAPAVPDVPFRPDEPARPDVWTMPTTGIEWCDCGCGHEVTEELVRDAVANTFGEVPDEISHPEVCLVLMDLWEYESVCAFFFDGVEDSARAVHGRVADMYPLDAALRIIGHFSKTWNGCPEIACAGGLYPEESDKRTTDDERPS